jgi:ATP-dependent DNA ligase
VKSATWQAFPRRRQRAELVAGVEYTAWSGSGRVRHAVYLGIREDKSPGEVIRDVADVEIEGKIFNGGVNPQIARLERGDPAG